MELKTKKSQKELSLNLNIIAKMMTMALENQKKGELMSDGQKPENVLKNIANSLQVLSDCIDPKE